MTDRLLRALEHCEVLKKERPFRKKWIYLLRCDKYYKIGYASNLKERLRSYKVHSPFDVVLICSKSTHSYKAFEKWMFQNFFEFHHSGEWYTLSQDQLDAIRFRWFR